MNQMYLRLLAILLTITAVSGTAYALFSSSVEVKGLTFSTGNADLKIFQNDQWTSTYALPNSTLSDFYPGYRVDLPLTLKNFSQSNIKLALSGQILNDYYTGDWNVLKNVIQLAITRPGDTTTPDWHSLLDWTDKPVSFPDLLGYPNDLDSQVDYQLSIMIDPSATNDISQKSLSGLTLLIVGTQSD